MNCHVIRCLTKTIFMGLIGWLVAMALTIDIVKAQDVNQNELSNGTLGPHLVYFQEIHERLPLEQARFRFTSGQAIASGSLFR